MLGFYAVSELPLDTMMVVVEVFSGGVPPWYIEEEYRMRLEAEDEEGVLLLAFRG